MKRDLDTISWIVVLNGWYDLLCGLAILKVLPMPFFGTIHLSMMQEEYVPIFSRFLAYWILANGVIRIIAGQGLDQYMCRMTVIASYILEAAIVANETFVYHTMVTEKGFFVILFSLMLAVTV
jgi:hypothetical protein